MEKIHPVLQRSAVAALVCIMALLAGCSYTVMPNKVPSIKDYETLSLKGVSLLVTNAEKDSSAYVVPTDTGSKSALRTNRQAWSSMIVEELATELAKRGATVRSTAPLKLGIALPEITFAQARNLYRMSAKVAVSSSTGWSKNYEGTAQSERSGIESVTSLLNRLAGQALAEAVRSMLGDEEFLNQIGVKKK